MMNVPSAYWLDKKDKIFGSTTSSMEGILEDALNKPVPELVVFIVYDLPNRDCHAKASNGEICCKYKPDGRCDYQDEADGCKDGLKEYQKEYIDPIAKVLKKYSGRVPVVLVIEPDSLPNLVTNEADPRCGNRGTKNAYENGVSYAVKTLAKADPYAGIYIDAGHGGWLGWKDNMKDFVNQIQRMDVAKDIRGFASNVAGYQYLGEACDTYDYCLGGQHNGDSCCYDPCGLVSEWNPSHNELMYALHLREAMSNGIGGFEPHMIIDTGRNGNPFADKVFYVNPSYKVSLSTSIATASGEVKDTLEAMMNVPSAYWLDKKDKIFGSTTSSMEGILEDALNKPVPELVVFIVYDLPNRDCHAKASNGEICCKYKPDGRCDYQDEADGCKDGLKEYQKEYIDPIAKVLKKYSGRVPVVLVIEPDSLPNLVTNEADPRCGNRGTKNAYENGVSYAVKTLAKADPYAGIYIDAGHGGWLGWKDNMKDFVNQIQRMDVAKDIRGFASNVAGYQYLGEACDTYDYCLGGQHNGDSCCYDPCGLVSEWNPSHNELMYALHLREAMSNGIGGFEPHMIIDTGRN
ncbi:4-beta-cellobiohydrolase 3) (Exocellobiohydrolase 3), partial [Durusdinium trenchii]